MSHDLKATPVEPSAPNGVLNGYSNKFERINLQSENPLSALVPEQFIAIIPSFTLESGVTLKNAPVAYTTRGKLSTERNNVMIICHALTGNADIGGWWGPLIGSSGRALDISRFFIICMNSLGSPYGTASPVTCKDGLSQNEVYGPHFPLTTIRDDVNLHKMVLDDLEIKQVAVVIGGSMGGMLSLEWAFFGKEYVRSIIPIATSSCHSAWGIGWGESQRQSIFADSKYNNGFYSSSEPPVNGLCAARMSALLTYRSRDSFEARFGRKTLERDKNQLPVGQSMVHLSEEIHGSLHNDGNSSYSYDSLCQPSFNSQVECGINVQFPKNLAPNSTPEFSYSGEKNRPTCFSAQSYLRYQGVKFTKRFDANCYIALTRKMDSHDLSRSRSSSIREALALIQQPVLVLGIESDGLFTVAEQYEIASGAPHGRLEIITGIDGHDAFLIQHEQINKHIICFLHEVLPDIMKADGD
ncbi:BgTH12-00354 [Blumeria graminis f. sp. triticale]|nr:BgTH12-00354 [Blumeria graminis f. sp. triticale]